MKDFPISRRHILRLTCGTLALASSRLARADEADPATNGRRFLAGLYDPELKLLPEFPGSKVYWLYHDNYLAAKMLTRFDPERSRAIREAIRRFGVTSSGKIEILFDEADHPLPFRHYRLDEVARVGDKVVKTEVAGNAIHLDWQRYADLLFLASISEASKDRDIALSHFEAGLKTWDGTGIRDQVNSTKGIYATYKLALALIAARRLGRESGELASIRRRLLKMQRADGGFVTDYDRAGNRVGQANVETTSLAIMAIDRDEVEQR